MAKKSRKEAYLDIATIGEELVLELFQIAMGDTGRGRHFVAFALAAKIQNIRIKPSGHHLSSRTYRRLIPLPDLAQTDPPVDADLVDQQRALELVALWLERMADAWSQNKLSLEVFRDLVGQPDPDGSDSRCADNG